MRGLPLQPLQIFKIFPRNGKAKVHCPVFQLISHLWALMFGPVSKVS